MKCFFCQKPLVKLQEDRYFIVFHCPVGHSWYDYLDKNAEGDGCNGVFHHEKGEAAEMSASMGGS